MIRIMTIIFFCFSVMSSVYASDKIECTHEEAFNAESDIDTLKTWDDLYQMYKRYASCNQFDDGGIAEGYSDIVGLFLANDWKSLNKLKKLCDFDKAFERFVYKHLDMTIPAETWEVMVNNATKKCPSGAKRICKMILKANNDIEQEIKENR